MKKMTTSKDSGLENKIDENLDKILDQLGRKIYSYSENDSNTFYLEQISDWHRFFPNSEEDKHEILDYYEQVIEIIEIFKNHDFYKKILSNNHYLCIGINHDRNFLYDKHLLVPIKKLNNFILKNKANLNFDYLELPFTAWDIDDKFELYDSNKRRTLFDITTNILHHYASSDYKDIVLSGACKLFYKHNSEHERTPELYNYLTLLFDIELEPQNKKEAIMYQDAICQDLDFNELIALIYEVRDYENIGKVDIPIFQDYCLNIRNRLKVDTKYYLNMGQIKVLVDTYDLVSGTLDYYTKGSVIGKNYFIEHLNDVMVMGDSVNERTRNMLSFCYDIKRLIKEDPDLFRSNLMQEVMVA